MQNRALLVALAAVMTLACTRDGDGDAIPDGSDRCPHSPSGRAVDASGCSDVARAFERGVEGLAEISRIAAGDVWVLQRAMRVKPDPALGEVLNAWTSRVGTDPFRRQIDLTAPRAPLPENPGHGLRKLFHYVMAPFGEPTDRAIAFMTAYLGYDDMKGYVLTHQFYLFPWCEEQGIELSPQLVALAPGLLERVAREHAEDEVFTDLWVERAATLLEFGEPSRADADTWIDRILAAQGENGVWRDPNPSRLSFDGQTAPAIHTPSHTSAFAIWSLAQFLERYAGG